MKPMTFERTIAARVDQVWAVMADIDRYAERFAGVDSAVRLSTGGFGVGTQWRETRTVYGRSATVENRVTESQTLHRYVFEAHVGARAITEVVFTPSVDGAHTSVRVTFQTRGGGPAYRLAQFLTLRWVRKCVIDNNTRDLADLARICEGEQRRPALSG